MFIVTIEGKEYVTREPVTIKYQSDVIKVSGNGIRITYTSGEWRELCWGEIWDMVKRHWGE
jgi:hypothetical protein